VSKFLENWANGARVRGGGSGRQGSAVQAR